MRLALSLILCSRNDAYMGDSRRRLETALDYAARRARELDRQDQVEIVVADWGSEVPLREVVRLDPVAHERVSFVTIPPDLARQLQGDSPFAEVLALNAAARRARGEYIGRIDQDTLVGRRFLETFFDLYEGRRTLPVPLETALLFSNRRGIPYRVAMHSPSIGSLERLVRRFGSRLPVWLKHPPDLFYCSYVGIWLAHRDRWMECGGYDERLIYMDEMESDMAARLMERHPMIDLGRLVGHDFYHLDHRHPRLVLRGGDRRKVNPKRWHEVDRNWRPDVIHPNDEEWGLADRDLDMGPAGLPARAARRPAALEEGEVAGLLFVAGVQMAWDRLIHALMYLLWFRRMRVAWEAIREEPPGRWPVVLRSLWNERQRRFSSAL